MKEIFKGVHSRGDDFYTENMVPGEKVYGEELVQEEGKEYREWDAERSKLGAALKKGLENFPLEEGSRILYLGAAQGTTPSHISDIVKQSGILYLVEFSERAMRDLLKVCEQRVNMIPILADARKPDEYSCVEEVEIIYEDVAQPDQVNILLRNSDEFLKKGGYAILAVKARAIDVTKDPEKIYSEVEDKLEGNLEVIEKIKLDPYEKDHCLIVARKN